MKAIMSSAEYVPYNTTTNTGGTTQVTLTTSTNAGYPNNCADYGSYGFISVPLPVQIVNTEIQALSEVIITGYQNTIKDTNFALSPGESAMYGTNWYLINSINGIYIQPVNTTTQEYLPAGNSTNDVLQDILNRLIALESWADNHIHLAGTLIAPSGGGNVTGDTGIPTTTSPSGNNINSDLTYISDGKNLISSNYKQYPG